MNPTIHGPPTWVAQTFVSVARSIRVLLAGLSPIAAEILVRYVSDEAGFEMAGIVGVGMAIDASIGAAHADVLVLGPDALVTGEEQRQLLREYPGLALISIAPDERSTCSCSRASPQDVLRRLRAAADRS